MLLVAAAALAAGAATLVAAGATTASTAVDARSCTQRAAFFNVQILGDRNGDYLFNFHEDRLGIPDRKTVVALWSYGGPPATGGLAMYAWITRNQTRLSTLCSTTRRSGKQAKGALRAPFRVRDGWNYGRRFACQRQGRMRIEVRDLARGKRITVRMERTGELVALAEVRNGSGFLRASKRCEQR